MRKYFTDYQCIMILKRCVERVALRGRGLGVGPVWTTVILQFCSFIIVLTASSHQILRS